jgi:hypothetical protein
MKKSAFSVMLVMVLAFGLAGCPSDDAESEGTGEGPEQGIEELEEFLDDVTGGGTPDDPIKVTLDNLTETDWEAILLAIANHQKYVDLDVTECRWGPVFDPGAYDTGEKFIVALALPDAAKSVKGGTYEFLPFRYFTKLKTLSAAGVETVGFVAFRYTTSLVEVSLPKATTIGDHAFFECKNLTTVSLPEATDIGDLAFYGCESLTEVSLPKAESIGNDRAFYGCKKLETVSLPAAMSIGNLAFGVCSHLTMVFLPETPPAIPKSEDNGIFFGTLGYNSVITLAVPNEEAVTTYQNEWGETGQFGGKVEVYGKNHNAVTIAVAQYQ